MDTTTLPDTSYRIALLIDSLAGGGAEKVVIALAHAFALLGHQPVLICLQRRQEYDMPESIPVHFLYEQKRAKLARTSKRQAHAQNLSALVSQIEQQHGRFDLFLSNLDETHYIVSACQFSPCFYVVHNAIQPTLNRALKMGPFKYLRQRRLFKALQGKALVAVSDALVAEIQSQNLFKPASVQRIFNPFDFDAILSQRDECEDDIPTQPYIIHIGRFAKQKRHDVLFKALRLMQNKSVNLVCLAGNSERIRQLAIKCGVGDNVMALGFKQNPYVWIKHAQCLVLSSDFEGFGNVIVEALACNTPVVSTNCPYGPNEIMIDEHKEFLVPVDDPKALAEAIDKRLDTPMSDVGDGLRARFDHLQIAHQYLALVSDEQMSAVKSR
ncbi:glycosyltransferase [Alteromonas facilis]|uniref:glycosyltransferase n=1 Tax=Alteromonas facilis TaxID=2048004 RepID=UPI000C2899EF|nr:glycosyltransferase [Alteromonas facilis]